MDIFIEQLVPKEKNSRDRLFTIIIIALVFVIPLFFMALAVMINFYFAFVAFGAFLACIYGAWFFITGQKVEYEYSVTNNNITIDKIIAKRKRKKIISVDIKAIDIMEKFNGSELESKPFEKVFSAESIEGADDVYAATFYKEKYGKCLLLFSPNEKILMAMRPFLKKESVIKIFYKR